MAKGFKLEVLAAIADNAIPSEWKGKQGIHAGFVPFAQARGTLSTMTDEQLTELFAEWESERDAALVKYNTNSSAKADRESKRAARRAKQEEELIRRARKLGLTIE